MTSVAAESPHANPSVEHEWRVGLLRTLGALTGHVQPIPIPLPDGRRPDVLMADLALFSLFLGDGKASEGPQDVASHARLDGYFTWLVPHIQLGRLATVAICTPTLAAAYGWGVFLRLLGEDHGVGLARISVEPIAIEAAVASAEYSMSSSVAPQPAVVASP